MLKRLLSRYHPRYVRSLVYMLQASEYDVRDFLSWYGKVQDFTHVEQRKSLTTTVKVVVLLGVLWVGTLMLSILAITLLATLGGWYGYLIFIVLVLFIPYILVVFLVAVLLVGKVLVQKPVTYFIVRNARKKLASHKAVRVGIAGSFGKTSMREILRTVLAEGKKVAAPLESYNTPLGISRFITELEGDEDVLVFELGEYYPGDVKELCELVQPGIGVITGVNEAHLEKFKSLKRTAQTVYELADYVGESGAVYVNAESEHARRYARSEHRLYSCEGVDGWSVENVQTGLLGTSFTFRNNGEEVVLKSKLLGLHQVGPLAAAAHLAVELGLSLEQVREGVSKTKPFKHRLEPNEDVAGVVLLDDSYNGNPDGVRAVIDFLATLEDCRRFYVTPGLVEMGERSEEIHKAIGARIAEAGIEKVVLIKTSVTPYIAEGLARGGFKGELIWFDSAPEAYAALPHLTVKGDVVLLQNDWPDQYL